MQAGNRSLSISSRGMRAVEVNGEYFGVSLLQLMENAGRCVAVEIQRRFPSAKRVVFFCGLGGNGGDGFVAARHLLACGYQVMVVLVGKSKDIHHSSALQNWNALKYVKGCCRGVQVVEVSDSFSMSLLVEADVVVDALLGTGSKGVLRAPVLQMVEFINSLNGFKVAVDVPTGVDSDSGEVLDVAVKADLTVTFYKSKVGLGKAMGFVGELVVCDIGLPLEFERFSGPGDVGLVGKKRVLGVHKGDFGRLLVVGGSSVFCGAPALASMAALRTGNDVVYTAAPEKTAQAISSLSPDLISIKLLGDNLTPGNVVDLEPYLASVDAVVLGPGLGLQGETFEFVKLFVERVEKAGKALLLDADGLKAFAQFKRPLQTSLVLTPHSGEYSILTGKKLPESLEDRIVMIQKTAKELKAVLLVKGNPDIICSSTGRVKLNFTGNVGMTVGGTGDVLAGIVGGLLAQKADAFEAAVAGAFVNGACGDFVASNIGSHMLASDLLEWIPQVFVNPMDHLKVRQ
ncbi:MAG: NAD(P)H-hydrate dehydratase [Candidatus Bathyarchaeota archaeon]|nr:NAD(P)H-hydrate dehydratase [Candidatus Termiticorpusculum sp.]